MLKAKMCGIKYSSNYEYICARLLICALWSHAGKGLTSWLSSVGPDCEFVTFPLVSWVRCTCIFFIVSIPDLCTLTYFHESPMHERDYVIV